MGDSGAQLNRESGQTVQAALGLGGWLAELATGRGVSVPKLLRAPILGECQMPADWSAVYRVAVFLDLIQQVADGLPRHLDRKIALAALNQYPGIAGGSPAERFRGLAERHARESGDGAEPPVTAQRLAARWRKLRNELGPLIGAEIENRNANGWEGYHSSPPLTDASDFQPFIVHRLEVTYFIDQRRVCTETITQRWITADLAEHDGDDAIDHYVVRAKYSDLVDGKERARTEILPMLNCRAGAAAIQPDGWLSTQMYFPQPLAHGDSVFFATRVRHTTSKPVGPAAFIQVTSLGVLELLMRVQFHPSAVPSLCWVYGGTSVIDAIRAPRDSGEDRLRRPNHLGYVEYSNQRCPPGWFYTIGWEWGDERNDPRGGGQHGRD